MTTAPHVLAAGQSRTVYAHTGYSVIHMNETFSQYRPLFPHASGASVLLAAVVLIGGCRRHRRWGELVIRSLLTLPVVAAISVAAVPIVRYVLQASAPEDYWPASLAWWFVPPVVILARARRQRDPVRRTVAVAAALLFAGIAAPAAREVNPAMLSDLVTMERLAAATEEQAVRLGHWPTQAEWRAEHGQPVGVDGTTFGYATVGRPRRSSDKDDWRVYAITGEPADPKAIHRRFSSDGFGPEGRFGARYAYPSAGFKPKRFGRTSWPHGRAPRDPNVKLPPWPEEAKP